VCGRRRLVLESKPAAGVRGTAALLHSWIMLDLNRPLKMEWFEGDGRLLRRLRRKHAGGNLPLL
jgi:hypothetical protein